MIRNLYFFLLLSLFGLSSFAEDSDVSRTIDQTAPIKMIR